VLDKAEYSAFESTLNSSIVSYRIVSYSLTDLIQCYTSTTALQVHKLHAHHRRLWLMTTAISFMHG